MKSFHQLEQILKGIDGKGYKAYKELEGQYQFTNMVLTIDHVQGDPFASPSRIRIIIPQSQAKFPQDLYNTPYKRRAVIDFLSRIVAQNISKTYIPGSGSGKSGFLAIGHCGQEILERNYIVIDRDKVEARLEVGLPAAGRRILGQEAQKILLKAIPKIAQLSLIFSALPQERLLKQVKLVEDQYYLRQELKKKNLVAFIANGSILPRENGISQRPLAKGAIPFQSPREYEVELQLPHYGKIKGMGIPKGITLIVGGGFHGKSTLLEALELGVYDHIGGDGREYLVTLESGVKIKAESGRRVEKVNISPFINNLPHKQDTLRFSTDNASGSTSQAANIMEALELGTELLLIDEDTSATNFMIRDSKMQQLVKKDKEPITPFIDRVQDLYEEKGVSTVLVIGGSGDYFQVAHHVIMMDEYIPRDVSKRAKEIAGRENGRPEEGISPMDKNPPRILLKTTFPRDKRGDKIKARGISQISYNKWFIDLGNLEQLIDPNQTNTISFILRYIGEKMVNDQMTLTDVVEKVYRDILAKGLDWVSPYKGHPGNMALPRKQEIAATLNRFRNLQIK